MNEYGLLDGTWRDLATGTDPTWAYPEDADGATDAPGTPPEPINTRLEGPWGLPWWDAHEEPYAPTGLFVSPDPVTPNVIEAYGAAPVAGPYDGSYRTRGPIMAFGHEPSGGFGDQAIGRIMRFPANIPERFDVNGVHNTDYAEELAASIQHGSEPIVTEAEYTTDLLLYI